MRIEDIGKIKVGDYLELWDKGNSKCYMRVVHVSDPDLMYTEREVIMIQVYPIFNREDKIAWDNNYLKKYVQRLVEDPATIKMIKLLYDC